MTEKFIVLDTETTNSIDDPFTYDIGWAVVDAEGNIYETASYVVAEIFKDNALMSSAYFAEKIPQYKAEIESGKRTLAPFFTIRRALHICAKHYGVTKFFAHNMRFDYRSTNLTQRFLTSSKYRYFFPYGAEICDTLKLARLALKNSEAYDNFCYVNNYLTKRGCKRYTAEIIYRFIKNENDFIESHTALEDVLIEKEILRYCLENNPNNYGEMWEKE